VRRLAFMPDSRDAPGEVDEFACGCAARRTTNRSPAFGAVHELLLMRGSERGAKMQDELHASEGRRRLHQPPERLPRRGTRQKCVAAVGDADVLDLDECDMQHKVRGARLSARSAGPSSPFVLIREQHF